MIRKLLANIIYGAIYLSGFWLILRYFNRRKTRILMYHGVSENDLSLWTQIPVTKFEQQMSYIKRHYRVLDLTQTIEILRGQKPVQDNVLTITFDDGFANNRTIAYDVLKKYNLPATIFLTTAFVNKKLRFQGLIWTDYVSSLFRNTPRSSIDLRDIGLWKFDLSDYSKRVEASRKVCQALKELPSLSGNGIIEWIAARLGPNVLPADCEIFKSLNWDEIRLLNCDDTISFGAHTVNHDILSRIPREAMLKEIKDSQSEIEQQIGTKIRHFAYPNGGPEDFNPEIREVVAQNFDCALTTIEGLNSTSDDLYLLKRIGVGNDVELWKFKLELAGVVEIVCNIQSVIGRFFAGKKKKNGDNKVTLE